ncbi:hypothetical protein [Streptomyces roseicoloratus]|uniref:hypothetical protein n=1 Tax=Streptomyces roseicoloratus TaxID=2508722 RepID=UPI001009B634|nr:hypothetical protein [Streptomyces roseicoloratus]
MNLHARRASLAAATALGITAGLTAAIAAPANAATAATAATATADEVVIPNPGRERPRVDSLEHTGSTGYAHTQEGTGTVWTDYATGTDTPISDAQAAGHSGLHATISSEPFDQPRTVTVAAVGSDTTKSITLPGGQVWSKTYNADTTLAYTGDAAGLTSLTLYRAAEDGTTTARSITDIPHGISPVIAVQQDLRGAILRLRPTADGTGGGTYLLDYTTATVKPLPAAMATTGSYALGDRHVVYYPGYGKPLVSVPRDNPAAQPVQTVLPTPVGNEGPGLAFAVSGDSVVYQRNLLYPENGYLAGHALRSVPVGGGAATELLKHAQQGSFATAPDGSVLVPGGSSALDWALHRISAGADGTPRVTRVRDIAPMPRKITQLAMGGDRLHYLSPTGRDGMVELAEVDTNVGGTPASTAPKTRFRFLSDAPSGLASLGDGDPVVAWRHSVVLPTSTSSFWPVEGIPEGATVVDGAGRFFLAKAGDATYVGDLERRYAGESGVLFTLRNSPAALWDTTLWKPSAATGTLVNSYDLKTKTTSAAIDLGSGCRPTELQASSGRWLYWACGADRAGVYDLGLKKSVPVPVGEALLGDGFVVRHEGDKLRLTDAVTGQTSDVADLPASAAGSGRRTTWTVDKFGGGVAYVDAAQDVHVKPAGLARRPLATLDSSVPALSYADLSGVEPENTWEPVWRFSRPVSWELKVTKGDGQVIRTFTGARSAGAAVRVAWDGKDSRGRGIESGQYRWELIARPLDGADAAQAGRGAFDVHGSSLTTVPGTYTPVTPARLLDTRSGLGAPKAKVGPNGTVLLKVGGRGGVPTEGLTSVVLNVTATNATADSFVSVYPYGTLRTSASSLNFTAGKTTANLVTVPVTDGYVQLYNKNGSVDLLADVAGYYQEGTAASSYEAVTPTRLMDTRTGTGVPKAKVGAGRTVTLGVTEPGVTAVAMNVTATNATATSFVAAYPYGTTRPDVSNLNFTAGQTVPNLVIVPVKDGRITFYNRAGSVDVIADVAGYFKQGTGSVFTGMQPKRMMDTRAGLGAPKGKVGAGQSVSLTVGTKYKAVVLNVTATNPTEASFVSVHPYGTTRTSASNLNFVAGQTVANGVVVPVEDGRITFYNKNGSVDLIADVTGYYTG